MFYSKLPVEGSFSLCLLLIAPAETFTCELLATGKLLTTDELGEECSSYNIKNTQQIFTNIN